LELIVVVTGSVLGIMIGGGAEFVAERGNGTLDILLLALNGNPRVALPLPRS
jgi:hypothetical protein